MSEKTQAVGAPLERHVRPLAWTDDRCKELDELGTLLREVASINHGSNCLERIHRCIALAEKLNRDDLFKCRDSLHNFLCGLAIADRSTGPAAYVEFSGVPTGHSSNHPAGGTSAGTQG